MRYSSATTTRAPWPAAIRAARTPPEPPPMTNRSVSKSAMMVRGAALKIMALLLHLGAEAVHHFLADARPPLLLHEIEGLIENPRFALLHLLAERRLVERNQILQLGFGERRRVVFAGLVDDLGAARRELIAQLVRDIVEVLA